MTNKNIAPQKKAKSITMPVQKRGKKGQSVPFSGKAPSSRRGAASGKGSASGKGPFRYATWLKCVAMLLGIVGVCFVLLGSYGTFRAILHQTKMHEITGQQSTQQVAPRAPDGSRPSLQEAPRSQKAPQSPQLAESQQAEPQAVREALDAAKALAGEEKGAKSGVVDSGTAPTVTDTTTSKTSEPKPSGPKNTPPIKTPLVPQVFEPSQAKMVIVIDDIGENLSAVRQLLDLDFPVTFAIWPHASHTRKAAMMAYAEGAEVILHQPMQPMDKAAKPGKGALYVGMSEQEIRATVQANLALVPHVSGLNNHMGSLFTQDTSIRTVCDVLKERRLFALDSVTHARSIFYAEAQKMGIASARRNVFLDAVSGEANVVYELQRAEKIAKANGLGIAIGHPFATTISGLQKWAKTRDKSIAIVCLKDIVH